MSFILDALRKSEAARRRHEAPDLFAHTATAPRPSPAAAPARAGRTAYALAALGIGALLLALWLAFGRTPSHSGDARADAQSRDAVAADDDGASTLPAGHDRDASAAWDDAQADAVADEVRNAPPPAPERVAAAPRQLPPSPIPATPNATPPMPRGSLPAPLSSDVSPSPSPPQDLSANGMPSNDSPSNSMPSNNMSSNSIASNPPLSPRPTAAAAPPPADATALRIADLDPGARKQLPPLKMSLHLWNETAAQRVVVLDGQRLGEGDVLGDVVVERIARDGVILSWRGSRLKLDVR